jgi:hypothetical protein
VVLVLDVYAGLGIWDFGWRSRKLDLYKGVWGYLYLVYSGLRRSVAGMSIENGILYFHDFIYPIMIVVVFIIFYTGAHVWETLEDKKRRSDYKRLFQEEPPTSTRWRGFITEDTMSIFVIMAASILWPVALPIGILYVVARGISYLPKLMRSE